MEKAVEVAGMMGTEGGEGEVELGGGGGVEMEESGVVGCSDEGVLRNLRRGMMGWEKVRECGMAGGGLVLMVVGARE